MNVEKQSHRQFLPSKWPENKNSVIFNKYPQGTGKNNKTQTPVYLKNIKKFPGELANGTNLPSQISLAKPAFLN